MNANMNTAIQPCILKGTQLNIFPINWKGARGIEPEFTINACTMMMAKNTFKKPGFYFNPLKIENPSSLTLKPLNNALAINSTK